MNDKPNLQLGDPPSGIARRQNSLRGIWLLGLLQILTLAAIGLLLVGRTPTAGDTTIGRNRLEEIRATAISLEDRSLAAEAASAWRESLRLSPEADDRAEVLYRIGGLLMDAEEYSGAVSALIEAEQLAADKESLKAKLGPKIVACLRRMGRYGEVGRELSRQVEFGGSETTEGDVLATFAGETLTAADLDRMIERTVDRTLAMQPNGQFPFGREELLKQYQSSEARHRMLQEILQRELFSRRARELKIDHEDAFQQTREFVETQLLAGQFLSRELAKIQPTDIDLESYYTANPADYRQPETASVIALPLQDDQTAADVLATIPSAEAFRELAEEANGDADVAPLRIVAGQPHFRLGDTSDLFELAEGEWTKTPISADDQRLLVLIESKTPATTPPLSQIRSRVEADYRRRKQQELTQRLSSELMSRYDVKIIAEPTAGVDHGRPAAASSQQESLPEQDK